MKNLYIILLTGMIFADFPINSMETWKSEYISQESIEALLGLLWIREPKAIFYVALPIIKQYDQQEIENLPISEYLKRFALELKQEINKKLFDLSINTDEIKILLDFGADVNTQNELGFTPLHSAASDAQYDRVKLLLEQGANPNIATYGGSTPLITTATALIGLRGKKVPELIKIAQLLIENKADIDALDNNNNSALSFAARRPFCGMIQLLLDHGADSNTENTTYGMTPLMLVAEASGENSQCQINIIKILINRGAKLFKLNRDGKTALDLAKAKGNTEVVNVLQEAMSKRGSEIFRP